MCFPNGFNHAGLNTIDRVNEQFTPIPFVKKGTFECKYTNVYYN